MSRFFAPGRVNLIGEHTDHADGLVLPLAIDRGVTLESVQPGAADRRVSSMRSPHLPEAAQLAMISR